MIPILQTAAFWLVASTAVLLVAWAATRLLAKSAAIRHLVWLTSFAVILLLQLLAAVQGPVALSHRYGTQTLSNNAARAGWDLVPAPRASNSPIGSQVPALAATRPLPTQAPMHGTAIAELSVAAFWFAGILFVGFWTLAAFLGVRVVYGKSVAGNTESSGIDGLASRLRVKRRLSLRLNQSATPPSAMTWGTIRPVVLLPLDAHSWPKARREAVLLHEIAHIRRFDYLSQIVAIVACALFWYNPLVWLAARAMKHEAELASDDAVIRSGYPAADYAAELLTLAAELGARRQPAACLGVSLMRRSKIEARIKSIVNPANRRSGLTWGTVGTIVGGGCFLAFIFTFVRPSIGEREKTQTSLYEEAVYLLTLNERRTHQPNLSAPDNLSWHPPLVVGSNGATPAASHTARSVPNASRLVAMRDSHRNQHPRSTHRPKAAAEKVSDSLDDSRDLMADKADDAEDETPTPTPTPTPAPIAPSQSSPTPASAPVQVNVPVVREVARPTPVQVVNRFALVSEHAMKLADEAKAVAKANLLKASINSESSKALRLVSDNNADARTIPIRARDNLKLAGAMKRDAENAICDRRGASPTRFDLPAFKEIEAHGPLQVRYVAGKDQSVRLLADPGSQAAFSAQVADGVLHLNFDGMAPNGETPVVDVVSPNIQAFELGNGAKAVIRGHFGGDIHACLDGSSAAAIEGTADGVVVCVDGSSNLTMALNGTTVLSGWVNGGSNLVSNGTVRGLNIHENGNSVISLARLVAPSATAAIDGNSWFDASGAAVNLTTAAGGDSTVSMANLNVESATISAAGSSQVSLGSSSCLTASANGSSKITYRGKPNCIWKRPEDNSTITPN